MGPSCRFTTNESQIYIKLKESLKFSDSTATHTLIVAGESLSQLQSPSRSESDPVVAGRSPPKKKGSYTTFEGFDALSAGFVSFLLPSSI